LYLTESVYCVEIAEKVLSLASLVAEDVVLAFEDLRLVLDEPPECSDDSLTVEKGVSVVGFLIIFKGVEVRLADFESEGSLLDNSALRCGYLSSMISFLSR
jgi:hypothetical protein